MIVEKILEKAYRLTNKNSTTFMDGNATNVLAELNTCYGHRTLDMSKVRQDANELIHEETTTLFSTVGLTAGDIGFNGEYPFDPEMLKPVRFEISYDGTTWNKATIYDLNENPNSEHDANDIQSSFSEDNPYVRFERNSLFVRPLKTSAGNITAGIHAWWENRQSDLTTLSPDFEQNLHDILAYDLANLERLMHPDKYDALWRNDFDATYARLQERFMEFFKNRFKRTLQLRTKRENYR